VASLFQVGVGSGGIVVLDALAREERFDQFTLIDPDVYAPHNVYRHLFPAEAAGRLKVDLAAEWIRQRRPEAKVDVLAADITDPGMAERFAEVAATCDIGICAVDVEPAKFAFDALFRRVGKPWTLGEVLSGGIGGWVHRFTADGPCYGCVASHLQRTVTEEPQGPAPDYSNPAAAQPEMRIPASRAAITAIAGLHAAATLDILDGKDLGEFTSILFTLARVPGVFDDAYRTYRFRIPKSAACLICSSNPAAGAGEDLDAALDSALARLGHG
jgi:tRNA A37 threonylcarbamoyladenosine dehydratase